MKIERILIEDQMAPIGLDEKKPAFSWLLTAEEVLSEAIRHIDKK